jgi:hypothetical protein
MVARIEGLSFLAWLMPRSYLEDNWRYSSVDRSQEFYTAHEHGSRGIFVINIRYQATASEDCNRLRRHSVSYIDF